MEVHTNVAEADVGKITPGMRASFGVDAHPSRTFEAVVRQVRDNATTLQNVVTYDAVLDVDNADRLLKPGMTANVTFTHALRDDATRLPNAALRFRPDAATAAAMGGPASAAPRGDQRVVWLLRGGRATVQTITVGISDGTFTEVVAGDVRPGDHAVVEAIAAKRAPR
jgi:HlyD family secretion protein